MVNCTILSIYKRPVMNWNVTKTNSCAHSKATGKYTYSCNVVTWRSKQITYRVMGVEGGEGGAGS